MSSEIPTTYPSNYLSAAGFESLQEEDKARCKDCGLEIVHWTMDMNPFQIHSSQKPDCRFIQSQTIISLSNAQKPAAKRLKTTSTNRNFLAPILNESEIIQSLRTRSFAHWSRGTTSSSAEMVEAGFFSCNMGDRVICMYCNLTCEQWTPHTNDPCEVHRQLSPDCTYVKTKLIPRPASSDQSPTAVDLETVSSQERVLRVERDAAHTEESERQAPSTRMLANIHPTKSLKRNFLGKSKEENINKRQKLDLVDLSHFLIDLFDSCLFQEIQRQSFSHWHDHTTGFTDQLINAGFFGCNVGDRVICIYCNLICQAWIPSTDDPREVHRFLSPDCIYVKGKLTCSESFSIRTENGNSIPTISEDGSMHSDGVCRSHLDGIVPSVHQNCKYMEITKRTESFASWSHSNLPSIDDFVNAGFFYTGEGTTVSCFYCNGFLKNWKANDDPKFEHIRWFPYCLFAKQFSGDEVVRKLQKSKKLQTDHRDSNTVSNENTGAVNRPLLLLDENNLSLYVEARLKSPFSQQLLNENFRLSVIKRCWEDQLRLKKQDFATEVDLLVACVILQKQIDHINGNKENIVIPSVRVKQIREENEARVREQTTSDTIDVETNTSSSQSSTSSTPLSNPCPLCLVEEKQVACIPCGHLATCVPCRISLRSCPVCCEEIKAFVRIYT